MKRCVLVAIAALLIAGGCGRRALAQKRGGTLKIYFFDSPATMSVHEESTIAGEGPAMGVFNNLVMFDQHVAQSGLNTIVPDLATEWSWNEERTNSPSGCGRGSNGMTASRSPPRTSNARSTCCSAPPPKSCGSTRASRGTATSTRSSLKGDDEVIFRLKRPQPAFIAFLASGFTPIYPCHVPARDMRQHPIGTGPFKFVEFKPNEYIKAVRNPDYWKKDRPYLDGIEWTIIKNQATGQLAFLSGKYDMTSPYFFQVPLLTDTQKQDPQAICRLVPTNVNRNVILNRESRHSAIPNCAARWR